VVVIIGLIWTTGTIHLFGFKITVLSGMIPPLITVIGLPNCVFIINKYQVELGIHGNKAKALYRSIYKVGFSNFLANVTTAIGFFVFFFTKSSLLVEFGLVAAFNVMTTYAVAHILIPIILSYMPMPKERHTKHLTGKYIIGLLKSIDFLVHKKRPYIYISLTIVTIVGIIGLYQIKVIGFIVDDLPKKDPIFENLRFFEKNFKGVLPFEVSIDTKKENGVFANNAEALYKIAKLQKFATKYPEFARPLSVVEGIKFTYQAYKDGKPKYYVVPTILELNKLKDYVGTFSGGTQQLSSFIDSTNRYTRISFQVSDAGSVRIKEIKREMDASISEIFPKDKYDVQITGTSPVFVKGNEYLFHHLFVSLIIAIVLIILVGLALFRSVPIILLSKLPCLIPLVVTAGIMGFGGIHFKPSTILVFSIAFGLASDGTIYILAEYWNQLKRKGNSDYSKAISNTINEVGVSMIYTASILFTGMAIFALSDFGGTVALGVLMSITIAVSLFTNLILLPSILLSLEKRGARKEYLDQAAIFDDNENGEGLKKSEN
jgi:predicted RND superfamily exporter protein